MSLNSVNDTVLLNGQRYIIKVSLFNSHWTLPIPLGILDAIIIEDSLYSIFATGKCIIDSTQNKIDQFVSEKKNELQERMERKAYAFSSDSRDHLSVYIKPVTDEGDDEKAFPVDKWALQYNFAVYDEEEVVTDPVNENKQKILYLRDARSQFLSESNLQWSTTMPVSTRYKDKINMAQVGNKFRQEKTGAGIKSLIRSALFMFDNKFAKDWDEGETSTFYTSSPQSNAYDDLEKLLDKHVGSKNRDNCVLGLDRNGDWYLRPYTKMFENAVNKQARTFGTNMGDVFNIHSQATSIFHDNAESVPDNKMFNFKLTDADIKSLDGLGAFNFLNVGNADSLNEIVTTFVHNYNHNHKQFNIDGSDTYIGSIKKKYQELYADKMVGETPSAILPINNQKSTNIITNHVYSSGTTMTDRLPAGVNRVINKCLAYAPGLTFFTNGSTHRTTSEFAIILKSNAEPEIPFNKILLGEWLMTKVDHHFILAGGNYYNNISCIKSHSYSPLTKEVKDIQRDIRKKAAKEMQASKSTKASTPQEEKEQEQKAAKAAAKRVLHNVSSQGEYTLPPKYLKGVRRNSARMVARQHAQQRAINKVIGDDVEYTSSGGMSIRDENLDMTTGKYVATFTWKKIEVK